MMLLRQIKGEENERWEYVSCTLNGVTRQCHLDVFLEEHQTYFCVLWSCTTSSDHPFRFVTYSGSPVAVKPLPDTENRTDGDSTVSSAREYTMRQLFSELILSNDGRHIHPIIDRNDMRGMLIGTYGGTQSSFYVLAVNGSRDHYLSIRINGENITDGQFVCTPLGQKRNAFSMQHQDFDIPPTSQQFLLVVTHTGTRNRKEKQNNPSFRYVSTWVRASPYQVMTKKEGIVRSFGDRIELCPAGENALSLHCIPSRNSIEADKCSGTIQTSFEYASVLLGRVTRIQ